MKDLKENNILESEELLTVEIEPEEPVIPEEPEVEPEVSYTCEYCHQKFPEGSDHDCEGGEGSCEIEEEKSIFMTENQQPKNTFYCDNCQLVKNGSFQQGSYLKRKVDAPFEPRMHKKLCYICLTCAPYVKEYNEAQDKNQDDNPYQLK